MPPVTLSTYPLRQKSSLAFARPQKSRAAVRLVRTCGSAFKITRRDYKWSGNRVDLPPPQPFDSRMMNTYSGAAHIHVLGMKTNITLKLDATLLREVRILAAEEGTSISALLAARLEEIVRRRKTYDRARKHALARLREGLDLQWTPPRSRDELHER